MKTLRIMICAGEISGDMYGAVLVRELRRITGREIEFFGIGGDRMKEEGVELFAHASQIGVMGFVEVAKRASMFLRLEKTLKGLLRKRKPDLLLTIDYPGLNMRLAAEAKKLGIRTAHYVCPQVWAWKQGRIPKIAAIYDRLVALFPFEPKLFAGTNLAVDFVGHPLVDQIEEFRKEPKTPLPWGEGHKIAIFAGSRHNEVKRILPDVLAGAAMAEERLGPCTFLLPVPSAERAEDVRATIAAATRKPRHIEVVEGRSRQVLLEAEAGIVKSGTSTLEAALLDCPFFLVYRANGLSFRIGKLLVGKRIRFIGLVNIVPDRSICPELIQDDLTPEAVRDNLVSLILDSEVRARQKEGLADVRHLLGEAGATRRAAELFAKELE